ncbi:hypothetical protein USDA257_c41320 [Sinorhizobium fredii USDA 257]|uniref:Uncharacterized protein n=1 Tax=Sinorhizobium fredii (strain USDA 257) TaxID=1185652 RepID=I3X9W7_SINF2|nr:hypothetical protein USDA257_c41320 [Sinorhizobium fredii USDA 257]
MPVVRRLSSPVPGISLPRPCRLVKGCRGPAASYNRLNTAAMRQLRPANGSIAQRRRLTRILVAILSQAAPSFLALPVPQGTPKRKRLVQSRCKSEACGSARDTRARGFRAVDQHRALVVSFSFTILFYKSSGTRAGENLAAAEFGGNAIRGRLFL